MHHLPTIFPDPPLISQQVCTGLLRPSNLEICFSSLLFEKSNEACAFFFFKFRSIFAEKIQKVMFFCCSFFWLLVSLFLHYQILKKKKKFRCGRFSRTRGDEKQISKLEGPKGPVKILIQKVNDSLYC